MEIVLAQLGKRIGRRIRREDVFARFGGGEFAIIAPESTHEIASDLGRRIEQIVGEGAFGFDDITIPVAISVGVSSLSEVDEEEAFEAFTDDATQETDVDPFNTDTSDVYRSAETDKFVVLAMALHQRARDRMVEAKMQR